MSIEELEAKFRELTLLFYDTSVSLATLEERVYPYLAPYIEFKDPAAFARGRKHFQIGLNGFHCVIRFDFEILQLHVQMNQGGHGGRVLVDGIMNLRQLYVYTYPLRTILVYDFILTADRPGLQITRLEEMWSLGDILEKAPLSGPIYQAARWVSGYVLGGLFWLGCQLTRALAKLDPAAGGSGAAPGPQHSHRACQASEPIGEGARILPFARVCAHDAVSPPARHRE